MSPVRRDKTRNALIVVFDESKSEGSSFFEYELKRVFEKQDLIYYKDTVLDAEALYKDISERRNKKEIYFPNDYRIVFCNYLDLKDLNEKWVTDFQKRVSELRQLVGINNNTQHYYFTCFRYQSIEPLRERAEKTIDLMNRMCDKNNPIPMRHVEFLLYSGGFDTFESQERGVVRLLYLLGIKSWDKIYDVNKYKDALYILNFDEYYESRALECQKKLIEINRWLTEERDPNQLHLLMEIQSTVSGMIKEYLEDMRKFKEWEGLYPVSIREYSPHNRGPFGIFGTHYVRNRVQNSEMEKQEAEYRQECLQKLERKDTQKKLLEKLSNILNYKDFQTLLTCKEKGDLFERIENEVNKSSGGLKDEDKKVFFSIVRRWIDSYVEEKRKCLEEEKQKKENEKIYCLYEQNLANKYKNLKDCFSRIQDNTEYQIPPAVPAARMDEIVLISEKVAEIWMQENYHIEGVADDSVIILDEIYPSEIQYLKLGKYISLNTSDTKKDFLMVIH